MPDQTSARSAPMLDATDLAALLQVQRRVLDAVARSGRILAEATRDCAERQAEFGRAALRDLWAAVPAAARTLAAGELPRPAVEPWGAIALQFGEQLVGLQRILLEAQLALLEELRRALAADAPAAPEASSTDEASPDATGSEPGAPVAIEPQPAAEVEASVEPPTPVAAGEPTEPARPRRTRRVAARA